jgi:hypothetical protein
MSHKPNAHRTARLGAECRFWINATLRWMTGTLRVCLVVHAALIEEPTGRSLR